MSAHVDLKSGPITLLTGFNSSGKSSVLQALGLLHGRPARFSGGSGA